MKYDFDIIIIGAGSAGLVVASGAASLGAKVCLIEKDKMGGDCLNTGCVPSKSFLKAAHLSKDIDESYKFGLSIKEKQVDMKAVMGRVKEVIESIAPHDSKERYEALGVKVLKGQARFLDKHTLEINHKKIKGKKIVIATGSEPFVPEIPGLKTIDYLSNENIFSLDQQPKHLIVLGGGPIGLELGQGFCHLGSKVTIIDRNDHLFKKDDSEVGPLMENIFRSHGMSLKMSSSIKGLEKKENQINVTIETPEGTEIISGDQILLSLGRKPYTKGLNLEGLGINLSSKGHVVTNEKLQTNIKNIYACGDVTGPFQFTHSANYQAGIVIRNALFPLYSKTNYRNMSWTTYTKPEVAHVGLTEASAQSKGLLGKTLMISLDSVDRAKAESDLNGFLKVVLNKKHQIIGASLVGEKAGEMIPLISLAIYKKLKATVFQNLILSYPTEAEIFKKASLEMLKSAFKPWQKKIIKKIFFIS